MCNHCTQDPRDQLHEGALALRAITDLVSDIRTSGGKFDCTGPTELAELLDMVRQRIDQAADGLGDYVPRGWKPPQE
jgi:hypothetical protein